MTESVLSRRVNSAKLEMMQRIRNDMNAIKVRLQTEQLNAGEQNMLMANIAMMTQVWPTPPCMANIAMMTQVWPTPTCMTNIAIMTQPDLMDAFQMRGQPLRWITVPVYYAMPFVSLQ
eukprot:1196221-Prorocentrum_minimum.AAC.7